MVRRHGISGEMVVKEESKSSFSGPSRCPLPTYFHAFNSSLGGEINTLSDHQNKFQSVWTP